MSAPVEFFHLVGCVIHTEPLPNDAPGVCELLHAPGAVAQAFSGHKNALPLVQRNCRRTITDPAVLAFAEHHIYDGDVLFRAGLYRPVHDATARFSRPDGVAWSSGRARASGGALCAHVGFIHLVSVQLIRSIV